MNTVAAEDYVVAESLVSKFERACVEEGLEDLRDGRVVDGEVFFEELLSGVYD